MIALLQAKADSLWGRAQIRPNQLVIGIVALPLAMAFAIRDAVLSGNDRSGLQD
jgi:hypothetical protein